MSTPAGIIEDLLCYFSASHRAEHELNQVATSGSGSGSGTDSNGVEHEVSAPKGLNPNMNQYKGFEKREGTVRNVPPPPNGRTIPLFPTT